MPDERPVPPLTPERKAGVSWALLEMAMVCLRADPKSAKRDDVQAGAAARIEEFLGAPDVAPVRVLAVDPGFAAAGICAIELGPTPDRDRIVHASVIRTEKNASRKRDCRSATDDAERAMFLARALGNVLSLWSPRYVVAEMPDGFGKGARSVHAMGLAKGILCAVVAGRGLALECVSPRAAKICAAGKAGASKEDVEAGVVRIMGPDWCFGLKNADYEHCADALACFLASRGGALEQAARMIARENAGGQP